MDGQASGWVRVWVGEWWAGEWVDVWVKGRAGWEGNEARCEGIDGASNRCIRRCRGTSLTRRDGADA
eukprot:350891-Chlamydomonas_euryale.AAC.13